MNKNGLVKIDQFLIAFVVFSFFVVMAVFLIQDINTNYDDVNLPTDQFNETFNTIDEMYSISQGVKNDTIDADISDDESWQSMAKGSYSAIRLVRGTFGLFGDIIQEVSKSIGIPAWVVTFAITVVTIMVIFALIFLVMGVLRR